MEPNLALSLASRLALQFVSYTAASRPESLVLHYPEVLPDLLSLRNVGFPGKRLDPVQEDFCARYMALMDHIPPSFARGGQKAVQQSLCAESE